MKKQLGFTLIELLITLVVMVILLSIAIPTYHHQVMVAKRMDAKTTLLAMAARMEHDYAEHHHYNANALTPSAHRDYVFSVTVSADGYVLYAKAINTQAEEDTACGTLTLDQLGTESPAACWA